ncbi:hypothetical protein DFH07DRAFT_794481 [Mycena maculata]|uniref:Uncharacterized protein n=1 Tax=Mycena maculata TaxID=230809 RepID=A0AAD7K863_9AGAR|nr:hypothetical protein DFH07DRAFT_794481 [Mycena maculata]
MGYVDEGLMNAWYAETAENVERWLDGKEVLHRIARVGSTSHHPWFALRKLLVEGLVEAGLWCWFSALTYCFVFSAKRPEVFKREVSI